LRITKGFDGKYFIWRHIKHPERNKFKPKKEQASSLSLLCDYLVDTLWLMSPECASICYICWADFHLNKESCEITNKTHEVMSEVVKLAIKPMLPFGQD